jgi:hypothetical protein
MKTAHITHSRDGYQVEIAEIPLRWLVAEKAGELALAGTGHVLCCRAPGWAYRVRWGPRDEESGLADRSLGHQMYRAGQWLSCLGFRHEERRASVPVTPEWVQEHFPAAREKMQFLEDGPDAMRVSFSD